MSLTGIVQPGTTSPPSRVSSSVRVIGSWLGRWTVASRLRGFTTMTMRVPASSQSLNFFVNPGKAVVGGYDLYRQIGSGGEVSGPLSDGFQSLTADESGVGSANMVRVGLYEETHLCVSFTQVVGSHVVT